MEIKSKTNLDYIFSPRSVVVVGASEALQNAGGRFLKSILKMDFKGDVYVVNPNAEKVFDCKSYPKISDIPGVVDHVIVSVPSKHLPAIIEDCVEKSVNSVAIFTSGFSESGTKEGKELEDKLISIASRNGLRIIGPNCMGIYCPKKGLSFRMDLPLQSGNIAMISQSGGIAITTVLSASEKNNYFSKVVSFGNESDLGPCELLEYFKDDDETSLILAYIEGSKNSAKLLSAIKNTSSKKPVIVLKGGLTAAGAKAVSSHTGAMAGAGIAWQAALRQSMALQVSSMEEMLDTAHAFSFLKRPSGKRLGIVSISGGLIVNITDLAIKMDYEIPPFNKKLKQELGEIINTPGTAVQNPVDMAVNFFYPQNYSKVFNLLDRDDSLDILAMHICIEYIAVLNHSISQYSEILINAMAEAFAEIKKPFFIILPYTINDEIRKGFENRFIKLKIPVFPTIERALTAINHCTTYYNKVKNI